MEKGLLAGPPTPASSALEYRQKKSPATMEEATYWQNNSSLKHQRK